MLTQVSSMLITVVPEGRFRNLLAHYYLSTRARSLLPPSGMCWTLRHFMSISFIT